jgi:hypothetical protein
MIKSLFGIGVLASVFAIPSPPEPEQAKSEPVEETVIVEKETWKCPECTPNEQVVLAALQEHTKISDRNALATIMGNIPCYL